MTGFQLQYVRYIFGLAGNPVLLRQVGPLAEDAALGRRASEGEKVRRWAISAMPPKAGLPSAASSPGSRPGPRVCPGERPGAADTRFIVTSARDPRHALRE